MLKNTFKFINLMDYYQLGPKAMGSSTLQTYFKKLKSSHAKVRFLSKFTLRWFVLDTNKDIFYYTKKESDIKQIETYSLLDLLDVDPNPKVTYASEYKFVFQVTFSSRNFMLYSNSLSAHRQWTDMLKRYLIPTRKNIRAPRVWNKSNSNESQEGDDQILNKAVQEEMISQDASWRLATERGEINEHEIITEQARGENINYPVEDYKRNAQNEEETWRISGNERVSNEYYTWSINNQPNINSSKWVAEEFSTSKSENKENSQKFDTVYVFQDASEEIEGFQKNKIIEVEKDLKSTLPFVIMPTVPTSPKIHEEKVLPVSFKIKSGMLDMLEDIQSLGLEDIEISPPRQVSLKKAASQKNLYFEKKTIENRKSSIGTLNEVASQYPVDSPKNGQCGWMNRKLKTNRNGFFSPERIEGKLKASGSQKTIRPAFVYKK
ncbi:unnamed protein product [Blepharisma stoltei]|uniref:PH domain-containing protein n=1 Tax=Blepharisma stoltei TaxID=1481888 RepID=A0AAU9JSS6_9CILI|nr:unnamed protein product [Blepharisma stoltei]